MLFVCECVVCVHAAAFAFLVSSSKSGTVDTREFYMLVHEKPSVFADSIFELIGTCGRLLRRCARPLNFPTPRPDVENEGQLDFSEFCKAISTYCMFGKEDILKCTLRCCVACCLLTDRLCVSHSLLLHL